MSEFEFHLSHDSTEQAQTLFVSESGRELSAVVFGPLEENPDEYEIEFIASLTKRHGATLALVKEMVGRIGAGKIVRSVLAPLKHYDLV
jgi:hypothetical protein